MFGTGLTSLLYIAFGTAALRIGITFVNGTLLVEKRSFVYTLITSPLLRMLVILPIMGIGHTLFSLALKINPVVASPAGIIFTTVPPAMYALWLFHSYPNTRIVVYILMLVIFALLLGYELYRLQP